MSPFSFIWYWVWPCQSHLCSPPWWMEMSCNPLMYSLDCMYSIIIGWIDSNCLYIRLSSSRIYHTDAYLVDSITHLHTCCLYWWSQTNIFLLYFSLNHSTKTFCMRSCSWELLSLAGLRGSSECPNSDSSLQILHLSEPLQRKHVTPSRSQGLFWCLWNNIVKGISACDSFWVFIVISWIRIMWKTGILWFLCQAMNCPGLQISK